MKPTKKGMPVFEPTDEQRALVTTCKGIHMSWDEIAVLVINPRTGRPISKETLQKVFPAELEAANAKLKQVLVGKFFQQVQQGHWPAIQFGLRHIVGWRDNDVQIGVGNGDGATNGAVNKIEVSFVRPASRGNGHDVDAE